MNKNNLSVREATQKDVSLIADYWLTAKPEYLVSLGVDVDKMFTRDAFTAMLESQLVLPYKDKRAYALIWEVDTNPIGHSNINPINYGVEASMHLHIWDAENRKQGFGAELIKMSLPFYFKNFKLQKLYCEPYALNISPNKLLQKAGFTFIKEYTTFPGSITFEQPVKRWEVQRDEIIDL